MLKLRPGETNAVAVSLGRFFLGGLNVSFQLRGAVEKKSHHREHRGLREDLGAHGRVPLLRDLCGERSLSSWVWPPATERLRSLSLFQFRKSFELIQGLRIGQGILVCDRLALDDVSYGKLHFLAVQRHGNIPDRQD